MEQPKIAESPPSATRPDSRPATASAVITNTESANAKIAELARNQPADTAAQKPAPEQIALLTKKPAEVTEKPAVRMPLKALEGYIIQLSFAEKSEAQRWAEKLNGRGFAISTTESGAGAFRVRVGNFSARDDAERQLKALNRDGVKGIVLNLPQAYRPDVHSAADEANRPAATVP